MELNFDLSHFAPAERFEFWHDAGSLIHRPIKSAYQQPSQLSVRATLRLSEEIVLGRMEGSEQYFERTHTMLKTDHIDNYLLVLLEDGSASWSTQDSHFVAEAGDVFLLDNQEICQSQWTAHRQMYAVLPRDLMAGPGWPAPRQRVLRSACPRAAILRHYLRTIWESQRTPQPGSTQHLAKGLASLTRIFFAEGGTILNEDNHQEPIKQTIKNWISKNLHNPDLDSAQVCSTFYLSRSTLYELFKPEGGIRTYLQACRLERARLILENPDCQVNVSTIANQLGFRSLSSFSRSFRDHWGLTPREAKNAATSAQEKKPSITQSSSHDGKPHQLRKDISNYYRKVKGLSAKQT